MAQVGEPRTDLAVGVNGGLAMNTMSFKPAIRQGMKMGLNMGFTARYTCEKYFNMICAFQGELNYSQAGWKEKPETEETTYQRTLHYVHMPLLANLGFGKEHGGVKGFLVIGPQLGFCIGETVRDGVRYNVQQALVGGKGDQHDLKVEKKFEYGITGGLGMDVSTKNGHHFIVEGRYFYGLSDIFGSTKKDPFGRSANSTIFVKVSYLFDVKRTSIK
ncbi:MAG: PorT family protein [Bacteroidaceae bacterium]|nr:PorT family protein [Bacteroidaceae bacterium]